MHLAADLCAQAVDDLVQGLRAGGVHVDEELVLGLVCARRAGLDVGEVDALFLRGKNGNQAARLDYCILWHTCNETTACCCCGHAAMRKVHH